MFNFNRLKNKNFVPFDKNWFKGKRVAVIGGADSAYIDKVGAYIDNFDVVIRINNGVGMIDTYKEYIGTKTDFLFHCLYANPLKDRNPITIDLWKEKSVGLLIASHNYKINGYGFNNINRFLGISNGKYPFSNVPEDLHKSNMDAVMPNSPTTGLIVINTIMNCMPKELYITGITFFRTSYFKGYRDEPLSFYTESFKAAGTHVPEREYEYVKMLYEKEKGKILVDSTLTKFYEEDSLLKAEK